MEVNNVSSMKQIKPTKEQNLKTDNQGLDINTIFTNEDEELYKDSVDILGINLGELA